MRILRTNICFAAASIGLMAMAFVSPANSQSGFHASSENLPATLEATNPDCYKVVDGVKIPGTQYTPGSKNTGGQIVPADVPTPKGDYYPVVRFDLGIGKYRGKSYKRKKQLRARDLTVAEVSIDTSSGEVALDGKSLTPPKRYRDCGTKVR